MTLLRLDIAHMGRGDIGGRRPLEIMSIHEETHRGLPSAV